MVQWSLHQPSFAVYRQAPVPRRAPEPGELVIVQGKAQPDRFSGGIRLNVQQIWDLAGARAP